MGIIYFAYLKGLLREILERELEPSLCCAKHKVFMFLLNDNWIYAKDMSIKTKVRFMCMM